MQAEIRSWFCKAVELSPELRRPWLDQWCPDHVRNEVLSLLEHDKETDWTLRQRVRTAAVEINGSDRIAPGLQVGVFRLGKLLGRGGMGSVFEGHRVDEQVDQTVAIKFLDLAILDESVRESAAARFLQERRILATLQHPYIASLIDVGSVHDIPYFVMERVDGIPIDRFAEQHSLNIRERIGLVLKVCEALDRAHKNLIVHRDIKPGNILVTADGTPKLLDFGIAKEILASGTCTVASALTPEYASPEQIIGGSVTVATDVYGIGGLLYRLLTGRAPHAMETTTADSWLRQVTQENVVAPAALKPELRGDLDNILRKALHRDPDRRYESVRALADDLHAWLEGRTVRATPDSFIYRTKTALKRNRLLAGMALLAAISLVTGTAVSIYQGRRAHQRFNQVRHLANVFLFDFEHSIREIPGTLDARKLVASTAQEYLQQLSNEARHDASLQREIAHAWELLANVQGSLQAGGGRSPAQTESLLRSIAIRRDLGDNRSSDPALHLKYIELASELGYRLQDGKSSQRAQAWADEAIGLSEKWLTAEPNNSEALMAATLAFTRGATTYELAGQIDRSIQTLEKAILYGQTALSIRPDDRLARLRLCAAERTYSELLHTVKRYSDALDHALNALRLVAPLWEADPADREVRGHFRTSNSAVGSAERALGSKEPGHLSRSIPYLRQAFDLSEREMNEDPGNTKYRRAFVVDSHRLASAFIDLKQFGRAAALYDKSGKVTRRLTELDPANRRSWYMLGKNDLDLGWLWLEAHQPAKARKAFLAADEGFDKALIMDPHDSVVLECRASQFEGLARIAAAAGRKSEARDWIARCAELMRTMVQHDASMKSYIFDYSEKLRLAQSLGVSTAGL